MHCSLKREVQRESGIPHRRYNYIGNVNPAAWSRCTHMKKSRAFLWWMTVLLNLAMALFCATIFRVTCHMWYHIYFFKTWAKFYMNVSQFYHTNIWGEEGFLHRKGVWIPTCLLKNRSKCRSWKLMFVCIQPASMFLFYYVEKSIFYYNILDHYVDVIDMM